MKKLSRLHLNDKAWVLADQAVHSGTGFITTLILVRLLSPEAFGVFTSIFLFTLFFVSFSNALIIQPLQVYISKVSNVKSYFSFTFFAQLIITLAITGFSLLVFQLKPSMLSTLQGDRTIIMLFVGGFILHDFFRKFFLAKGTVKAAFSMDLSTGMIQLISFIISFQYDVGLTIIISIAAVSFIPSIVGALLYSNPKLQLGNRWRVFLRVHIREGKWLLMTSILQWWASNLFVVASGVFLGAKAIGVFRLVQTVFGVLNVVLQTLENYALPFAARLFQNSIIDSKKFLKKLSLQSSALAGGLLLVVFGFPQFFLELIAGPAYIEYTYLIKGMAVLYFIIFLGYPIRIAIRMLNLNQFFFIGYLISFLFSLISFNYLLREWHLWGAIIGLITNQIILIAFWQYVLLNKQYNLWK